MLNVSVSRVAVMPILTELGALTGSAPTAASMSLLVSEDACGMTLRLRPRYAFPGTHTSLQTNDRTCALRSAFPSGACGEVETLNGNTAVPSYPLSINGPSGSLEGAGYCIGPMENPDGADHCTRG